MTRQLELGSASFLTGEIVVDYFCGGGGASEGITRALGRPPTIAINHDEHSIRMHGINHPQTLHLHTDVWDVDPVRDIPAGDVGLAWMSPDCKHFSRAKGSTPLSKRIRGLAWVALRVAAKRRPRVLVIENVSEFKTWGPLNRRRRPIKAKAGKTFDRFVGQLRALGYVVEHQVLNAAHYGAPTHRKRLFLIARRDGLPVVWPAPTHGPGLRPFKTAAECIDWSIPVPSIFDRKKPLAEATQRRIAEGIRRFVLNNPQPFLVQVNHGRDVNRSRGLDEPLPTITSKHGFGVVAPTLIQTSYGERKGQAPRVLNLHAPLGTVVAGGQKHGLVAAFLSKFYGGVVGHGVDRPLGTVTAIDHHGLAAVHLTKFYGSAKAGVPVDAPAPTVSSGGGHGGGHAGLVAAFLTRYLGESIGTRVDGPAPTICGVAQTGLVTITIAGEEWALVDIGLRMLSPRELATCQGFGPEYVLVGTQAEQVARVGNSVCPDVAAAIVRANLTRALAEAAE